MRIKISPEAMDFIAEKGNNVYIVVANAMGRIAWVHPVPSIYLGVPKHSERFVKYEKDGVNLYIDLRYPLKDEIRITLDKIFNIRKLYAEGRLVESLFNTA